MAEDHVGAGPDMGQPPPSVAFMVSRLGFQVSADLARGLAPLGIQPQHFGLLRALAHAEGESQRAIGLSLNIPPNRMVTLVDDLEKLRLVRRRPHRSDRRAHALYLTPAGTRMLGKALQTAIGIEANLCAGLEPAERQQLLTLLAKLTQPGQTRPGVHPGLSAPESSDTARSTAAHGGA